MTQFTPTMAGGRRSWRATAPNGVAVGFTRSRNRPTGFSWWACTCSAEHTYGWEPTEEFARARALAAAAAHAPHKAASNV